jgi:hypothetical protein
MIFGISVNYPLTCFVIIRISHFDNLVSFKAITHLGIKALDKGLKISLKVK